MRWSSRARLLWPILVVGSGLAPAVAAPAGHLPAALAATSPAPTLAASRAATGVDRSFGGGFVTTAVTPREDEAFAVAVQPDGATVVVGRAGFNPFDYSVPTGDVLVSRYTVDGQLDTGFGSGGSVVIDHPSTSDQAWGVALQPDGKIVVAAMYDTWPTVFRFTTDGRLDPSFGGGIVSITNGGQGPVNTVSSRLMEPSYSAARLCSWGA
ncbi:MAG: delta-60 repeat domain-containing protein [Acidimicrobiales bacterium]